METLMLAYLVFSFLFQTSGGTITGKLLDYYTRQPIDGAGIVLEKTAYTTMTNKGGEFTLANVPPGTYRLNVLHSRYPIGEPRTIVVKKDSTTRMHFSMLESHLPSRQFLKADTTRKSE